MILEGLARVHLPANLPPILTMHHNHPLITSSYSVPIPSPLAQVSPSELGDVRELAITALPSEVHAGIKALPLLVLLDVLILLSGVKWEVQVESLALTDRERLEKIKAIYAELAKNPKAALGGMTPTLPTKAPPRASKPRKTITAAPPEDDLAPIRALFSSRQPELTPEAADAIKRELSRLGNIPIQSAEYGVTKTYVEWLLALPWKRVGSVRDGEIGLEEMRDMLESEHEGLQDVKRRVVEYLAVYRLVIRWKMLTIRLKRQLHIEEQNRRSAIVQEEVLKDASLMDPSLVPLPTFISPEVLHNGTMDLVAPEKATTPAVPNEEPVFRDRGPILLLVRASLAMLTHRSVHLVWARRESH
jgi:ATP-dependent Lon protease